MDQGAAQQGSAQILGQRPGHTHREDAGLFQRVVNHGGAITRRKNDGVRFGPQGIPHPDKALFVQSQAGITQPGGPAGLRHPDDFIGRQHLARVGLQAPGRDLGHLGTAMHLHSPFRQYAIEGVTDPRIVGAQNPGISRKEMKMQCIRITAERHPFTTQAVLHRQGEFDTAGSRPHQGNGHRPRLLANTLEQGQPAFIEAPDRLNRHGIFAGPGHLSQLRRRTDIDREGIVRDRRAMAAQHPA